jgi:chromosome partitioning protein
MLYAFCTQKGGVGKSTIAVHAAVWLAEKGRRVALVDGDAQASSSIWLAEVAPEIPLFRVGTPDDVLNEIPKLKPQFDDIVFDGPGSISEINRAAMLLADTVFLPCGPTVMDLRSAYTTVEILRQAQMIRNGLPKALFIPSKIKKRHRMSTEFIETAKGLGLRVSKGLRVLDAYADAVAQGTVVWRLGPKALDAGTEIQELFMEIFKDEFTSQTLDERRVENG